ncbi:hypothetical protein D3C83_151010 [compost metagenome]
MIIIAIDRFTRDGAAHASEQFVPGLPFFGFLVEQFAARQSDVRFRPTQKFFGKRE